jgi:pimeloyl-ACP methyl ester carboxylesterase
VSIAAEPVRPAAQRWRTSHLARWLLIALSSLVGLCAAGMIYQSVGMALDRRAHQPVRRLVDMGGYMMHLHCTGQGSPTVVLEAGSATPGAVWAWVQPEIARQTRVCSYDRAGVGWSDPSPYARDAASIARELHILLLRAGEPGPFVLAGHSLGGQYALMFALRYPESTVGLVLIDAQHPDTLFRTPEAQRIYQQQLQQVDMLIVLSRLGIIRLLGLSSADSRLPEGAQAELNRAKNRTSMILTYGAELRAVPVSREQLLSAGHLGDMPLTVISATEHEMSSELEAYTMALQRELALLSTHSRHVVIDGADHSSLATAEAEARQTARAILDIVALVRRGSQPH